MESQFYNQFSKLTSVYNKMFVKGQAVKLS